MLALMLSGCESEELIFDYQDQFELDRQLVMAYLESNGITAKESIGGLWYEVIEEGNRDDSLTVDDQYVLDGELRKLDGSNFKVGSDEYGDFDEEVDMLKVRLFGVLREELSEMQPSYFVSEAPFLVKLEGEIKMYIPSWLAFKDNGGPSRARTESGEFVKVLLEPNSNLIFQGTLNRQFYD